MSLTVAESAAVIGDLRRTRRKQRVAAIHWVDALYQVYITALVAVVGVVAASGLVGDGEVAGSTVLQVVDDGPALLGLAVSVAVLVGLRSGSRGGPLALERADVRHVLLAPVDRGVALRGPAWRQLRFVLSASAALGAAAGLLAGSRLPGSTAEWLAVGAAFAVVVVGCGFGAALVASGLGVPPWLSSLLGLALVGWSVADLTDRALTAPSSIAGRLGVWPIESDVLGLAGPVAVLVLVGAGMAHVAGTSLEAAERRTSLVGQMRFAVTLQDLRTVLVLRRQLAQERPRSTPWIRGSRRPARLPVVRRGVRSVMRWPAGRIVRVLGLAVVAGLAFRGAWAGTTPLVVLAGIALWVAALDAVEPMGQEIDHPGLTDSYPMERGELLLGLFPVVLGVSAVAGAVTGLVALVPVGDSLPVGPALASGVVAGLLAGCGAAVSTIQGAPSAVDVLAVTTPEIAGARTVMRTAWPPGLAVAGTAPLLLARAAHRAGDPTGVPTAAGSVALVAVVVLVGGWVRFHDDIHEWFRNALEQASPSKAIERAAAEREAAERAAAGDDGGEPDEDREDGEDSEREPAHGAGEPEWPVDGPSSAGPPKKRKSGPPAGPTPTGVQGGTSAKPIGRKRDIK